VRHSTTKIWLDKIFISKKPLSKNILAKQSGKLSSWRMKLTVKTRNHHRDTAVALRFFFADHCSLGSFHFIRPSFHATPFSPDSGLPMSFLNGLHSKEHSQQ
jgi:hypothetical protein